MEQARARRPHLASIHLVLVAVAAACTGQPATTPADTSVAATATTTRQTAETTIAAAGEEPAPCRGGAQPFSQEGGAGTSIRSGSDAETVGSIRWARYAECERMTIDLVTGDSAPAVDPPSVSGFFFRESAVLRVSLGQEIVSSLVSYRSIDTDLMERAFVVTAPDGGVFVDIHLADPVFARVSAASSPARAVVDLQPGGPDYQGRAMVAESTVVIDPVTTAVRFPFSVAGYATGRVTATARLEGLDQTVEVSEGLDPRPGTWSGFVLHFPDGPVGDISLVIDDEISMDLTAG